MSAQLTVIRSTPTHRHTHIYIHLQINNNVYYLFLVDF